MSVSKQADNLILIVGLGNPDQEYQMTRHNVGFMAADFLAQNMEFSKFKKQKKFRAEVLAGKWGAQKIILAKPQTFMNNSGEAVAALKNFYQVPSERIIIIYDELDLPFGKMRIRPDGSSAGHNGIKSIIEKIGTDKFWRVRIGISNERAEQMEAADFVLSKFSREEKALLTKEILPKVAEEVEKIIKS
ncbi:MAG TPA: aminoacyl-tRNA hydrolase [Patescibacteria group bacterium]|nr:aminoacyl-tRNA hydrolase [Patescibacteria group bacterium]